jgi:exodeoxyribonuclease V alpha subunit
MPSPLNPTSANGSKLERVVGIVERVTFHSPETGWTVLRVSPFREAGKLVTVLVHQAKVFAGSTMEFTGSWSYHQKHGDQFKAVEVLERKPATAAALEKYLGSGMIKGVGPQTARKIVSHFGDQTLEVFESKIQNLMEVPGIAERKLAQIKTSWEEHKSIRDVMIFLQGYGISTLFAVKIYKAYGDQAISIVSANPYRLAHDIYGIGFFSADKIALKMGFATDGVPRIEAGIKHVLASSRDQGHCYLRENQIITLAIELLGKEIKDTQILPVLESLVKSDQVKTRALTFEEKSPETCYYSKTLFFDEMTVAEKVMGILEVKAASDSKRIDLWITRYCAQKNITLSDEQQKAVIGIAGERFSVLTGGPGCGKTTTTKVLVELLFAMKKNVLLAAPTGRAAQRMTEVIGSQAKTLHRLLEWAPDKGGFKKDEKDQLNADFIILDECSMLDISLAASVLKAIPKTCQVLFIGDPDQLPAVGAGDVLSDLLKAKKVPRFRLTKVFRQAAQSSIIRYAHEINSGIVPKIISPIADPKAFSQGIDCLFLDGDEATQEQMKFLERARSAIKLTKTSGAALKVQYADAKEEILQKGADGVEVASEMFPDKATPDEVKAPVLFIPEKFKHVDLEKLSKSENYFEELCQVIKSVHPWSSLHYNLTASDSVVRLYTKTIREWLGEDTEIQVLTPQVRGTLGTLTLNQRLQEAYNPHSYSPLQIQVGDKILRLHDRVIQTRNNYDLNVFNGDIGEISEVNTEGLTLSVTFGGPEPRVVEYARDDLSDLQLAYAITIHKSQGSEFQAVIIPVVSQHFNMLFRNLIYTGLTRAKKLAIFVGSRKAFAMAVHQIDNRKRQTTLTLLLDQHGQAESAKHS